MERNQEIAEVLRERNVIITGNIRSGKSYLLREGLEKYFRSKESLYLYVNGSIDFSNEWQHKRFPENVIERTDIGLLVKYPKLHNPLKYSDPAEFFYQQNQIMKDSGKNIIIGYDEAASLLTRSPWSAPDERDTRIFSDITDIFLNLDHMKFLLVIHEKPLNNLREYCNDKVSKYKIIELKKSQRQ